MIILLKGIGENNEEKKLASAIILICIISLSVGVYAFRGTNVWDKIFKKDIDNISFEELDKAKDEHLKLNLSAEEQDQYSKMLKEAAYEKSKEISVVQKEPTLDTLIKKIERDIQFFEESINYDSTLNEHVKDLKKERVQELKDILILLKTKENSYEYYFSIYEEQRLKYIDKYRELRDK